MILSNRRCQSLRGRSGRAVRLFTFLILAGWAGSARAGCELTVTGNEPLPDMGSRLHQGFQGGLYPGGRNFLPAVHRAEGLDRAVNRVVPRARDGRIDPVAGAIVMISIGMSNTSQEFTSFQLIGETDPALNPRLVIINGAQGGNPASAWVDPNAPTWEEVDRRLQPAYDPRQVQVAWVKQANGGSGPFPTFAQTLQADVEAIARNLKTNYPNLVLAFFSSRTRAYTTTGLSPEPTAYETGFAVKWMIENQIQGTGNLGFDAAPWLGWGPYLWVDGLVPRSDGFIWECGDTVADFTHPSNEGKKKVADQLMAFFKTDPAARPWFLKPASGAPQIDLARATPANGPAPLEVRFSAAASDPDGVQEYVWTFGDGTFSLDQNPLKTFSAAGEHQAHLTVIDSLGNASFEDLTITVGDGEASIFNDTFEDGVLARDWNFQRGVWEESGGSMNGVPDDAVGVQIKARAIADPAFTGCGACTVEAMLEAANPLPDSTPARVSARLLTHYLNNGTNFAVTLKPRQDKIVVRQKQGTVTLIRDSLAAALEPGVVYRVRVSFDGLRFQVFLDGSLIHQQSSRFSTPPSGTFGLQSRDSDIKIHEVSAFP